MMKRLSPVGLSAWLLVGAHTIFSQEPPSSRILPDQLSAGGYILEAAEARPLLEDNGFRRVDAYQGVPGFTVAEVPGRRYPLGMPAHEGVFWSLRDIEPGAYWPGLVFQSSSGELEGPSPSLTLYLNGRVIQATGMSDPQELVPGVWFAELQSDDPVHLAPGDEIGVMGPPQLTQRFARLHLHAAPAEPGSYRAPLQDGGRYSHPYTAMRVTIESVFFSREGGQLRMAESHFGQEQMTSSPEQIRMPDGRGRVRARLSNPLPKPVTVEYAVRVRAHFGREAGLLEGVTTIPAHAAVEEWVAFEVFPDEPAYSSASEIRVVDPPDLGWPEADTLSFFPGFRQSMPWPDSFSFSDHRRLFFTDPVDAPHQRLLLDGAWEIGLTRSLNPGMPVPEDIEFERCTVPARWSDAITSLIRVTPRAHGAYFRRTFSWPDVERPHTVHLVIDEVVASARAYVNGIEVGSVRGERTPLVADLSSVLRPGENELVVVAQDLLSVMNPDYVNPEAPVASVLYLDAAAGTFGRNNVGLGSVRLDIAPTVSSQDILLIPSVRKGTLGVRMRVVNSDTRAVRLRVIPQVQESGQTVQTLEERALEIAPQSGQTLEWEHLWADVRLWDPSDPHLYTLAVELLDADSGDRLDFARERFGFRETWIEGPRVMFNGRPIKLKGATGYRPLGMLDNEYDLSRGSHAPYFTDETGLLFTEAITGVYNSSSTHNADRDAFWESARQNAVAAARQRWNHPSLIAWDLSNEWYGFLEYSGDDPMRAPRQLRSITDAVQANDPTRWTFYNGDGDLSGLHEVYSGHYNLEGARPHPISGFGFQGRSNTFPDGAFWRPLEGEFRLGESLPTSYYRGNKFVPYGEKVSMNTENLWKVGRYMPPGLTKIAGEDAILSPAVDGFSGPVLWFWKQNIDAHRDMGMNSVSSYAVGSSYRRGYPRQTFILPDTIHQGFSGDRWVRRYSLHNDVMRPAVLTWRWALQDVDGLVLAGGEDRRAMESAGLERGVWDLTLPEVGERSSFTLVLRLEQDGRLVYGEERDLEVWPRRPVRIGTVERQVHLFDPPGQTAEALSDAGLSFERLPELDLPELEDPARHLVLIGEEALDPDTAQHVSRLRSFVAAGGRVVVLAQKVTPSGLPAATMLEPREWSSQPFVRLPIHPVLEGITTWDLHFWAPERISSRGAYAKPDLGSAVVLVDSGNDRGLEWVQLMELPHGRGSMLVCQLGLVRSRASAPMAGEMLARLLRYAGGTSSFVPPDRALRSRISGRGALAARLDELGVEHTPIEEGQHPSGDDVVLLEASQAADQPAVWADAVRSGATLVVYGARTDDQTWLSQLAGTEVSIQEPARRMWHGRGYRVHHHPLTAGLSHADLYWKRFDGREAAGAQAQDPELAIEALQDHEVSVAGGRELVFPGALVEFPVGRGRLILDQRRWSTTEERLAGLARRQASSLFLGMGVRVASYTPPRPLPESVRFQTIDLSPHATRSLIDEVPEDGQGGFTDQGPDSDLRLFPTGRSRFAGIPFWVGEPPNSCIVLSSSSRPFRERLPQEVTIPVGFPAEGFFFLHTAAYTSTELIALYEILYEDGEIAEIPIRRDLNMRDWIAAPGPFPREQETRTTVAWASRTPRWVNAVVYHTLWVNPRPGAPVHAVRFSNPGEIAVPVLLGLTAAVPVDEAQRAADAEHVAGQLGLARAAMADGRVEEAIGILRRATAVEQAGLEAYPLLADLLERSGEEDDLLAFYREWIDEGATVALPFNRVGEILEKRGDLRGALAAYEGSLEAEWNQPPIIEAKFRLERQVLGQ